MTQKSYKWEFKIYENEQHYDNCWHTYWISGFNKREVIKEAKSYVKDYFPIGNPIVKIQTNDREQIEVYTASNRYGKIIFTKQK